MEVTCERCSTVYDFDDALVSERGTTVKCTTCSHQFKVRRTVPATGPDVWVVRTVDGRELEFAALRDLQAAIYDSRVTRDDVLVKGSSRPRRLGSIAELEPFFNRMAMTAPNPQRRARPQAGAGSGSSPPPAGTNKSTETSVVFTLPNVMRGKPVEQDAPPAPAQNSGQRRGSIPPPPPARRQHASRPTGMEGRFGDPNTEQSEDEISNHGVERISALPPPPPPPRRSVPPPNPMFPPVEPPPPPSEHPMFPPPEDETATLMMDKLPPPAPAKAAPTITKPSPGVAPAAAQRSTDSNATKRALDPGAAKEAPTATTPNARPADKPDASPAKPPALPKAPAPAATQPSKADTASVDPAPKPKVPSEVAIKLPAREGLSESAAAPTPSFPPRSDPYSDPRHSGPVPSRRAGAARWIVGVVLLGCVALAAAKFGPSLVAKPAPVAPALDTRVTTFLELGDRAMNDGDLEAANDAYVKASALADKDPRVNLRLARLAIVRADVTWLKLRLMPESDPDFTSTQRELTLAATRANEAAERAQETSPNDPDATRCRIDTLRQLGNVAEARKLVASLSKPAGVSNDEMLFALLDLAEPSPTWPTVVERLSNAARGEQNLGRARTMLIYALVRSGDITRAKAELEQLVLMARPHPLIGAFRAFIAQAEKLSPTAASDAGVDDGGTNDGGTDDGGVPTGDNASLQAAIEAMNGGDLEKASGLLQDLETRLATDPNVLTAAGQLALKKRDRTNAMKYFEKAIAANKDHFDAMAALADTKWDGGDKQGASMLYRQIIERAAADNPHMTHAKQRLAAFADYIEE